MSKDTDFIGITDIILRPSAASLTRTFQITVCSSAKANDGHIPFGRTIGAYTALVYTISDAEVTSDIKSADSRAGFVITVKFKYSATYKGVNCYLILLLTLDDSSVIPVRFELIRLKGN